MEISADLNSYSSLRCKWKIEASHCCCFAYSSTIVVCLKLIKFPSFSTVALPFPVAFPWFEFNPSLLRVSPVQLKPVLVSVQSEPSVHFR